MKKRTPNFVTVSNIVTVSYKVTVS